MTTKVLRFGPKTGAFVFPFSRSFGGACAAPNLYAEASREKGWTPAVDVRESDDAFTFTAELPGVDKDNLSVTLEKNVLTLEGERPWDASQKRDDYRRLEGRYGTFHRAFTLNGRVDAEGVTASTKDGVLTVVVPKAAEAKPQRIAIN